jgi:methionyl-tRNA formyltransferase
MKIAYCGYDFFHTCLRTLLDAGHEVHRIYSFPCDGRFNFNTYIREIARNRGIPFSVKPITAVDIQTLKQQGVELLLTAGYQYKIPDLSGTPIKGINIHPTLLPAGRGVWPLPWIILKQLASSGVTVHKLSNEIDAGDILLQDSFTIDATENLETLSCKVQLMAVDLLKQVMENIAHCWQQASVQQGEVSHWPMPGMQDRYLDWQQSISDIDRIARAFSKFGSCCHFDNKMWWVHDLNVWRTAHDYTPGAVVHRTNTETVIAASDGLVCLRYFQQGDSHE